MLSLLMDDIVVVVFPGTHRSWAIGRMILKWKKQSWGIGDVLERMTKIRL